MLLAGAGCRKKKVSAPLCSSEKEGTIKKEECEEKEIEKPKSDVDENASGDNIFKTEEITVDESEFFKSDYYNDDDDFEWKEEPLVEIHDDSIDSEGQYIHT